MATIKIKVDGRPVFHWDGDAPAIAHILEGFPRAAHSVGMTPQALASNCVFHLSQVLHTADAVGREMQTMGVIWYVLTQDTNNAEHPGKIADYADTTNFDVDFETKDSPPAISASLRAFGQFDA